MVETFGENALSFLSSRADLQSGPLKETGKDDDGGDAVDDTTVIDFGPSLGPGWTYMEDGRGISGPFDFVFREAHVIPYPWMQSALPAPKKRIINHYK